jgi:putative ABC transport system permease protein
MFQLALATVRRRPAGVAAMFVSMFLGAIVLMAFASLLDVATAARVPSSDKDTLFTMATVVGGWGLMIVVFAVASTLGITVRQRAAEMALLRSIGATPRQTRRLLVGETLVVAVVAALAAIVPAFAAGRLLFELVQNSGQVSDGIGYRFGPIAVATGIAITVAAATIGGLVGAKRATKVRAREALVAAEVDDPRLGKKRVVFGFIFLALGLETGTMTATVMKGEGVDAMQTGGQASIWFAMGLACFAPILLRRGARLCAGLLGRLGGDSGAIAAQNLEQRAAQRAGALIPLILFVAIATGTIYMQAIENAVTNGSGIAKSADDKSVETLNFVVVGMIAVFAAIMLINALVAATMQRRREFAQLRLAGATPGQVHEIVSFENVGLLLHGIVLGSIASLVTVVPYSIARDGTPFPSPTVGIYFLIVSVAVLLTLATGAIVTRRTIATPAVAAIAA